MEGLNIAGSVRQFVDQDAFDVLYEAARSSGKQKTVIAAVNGLGLLGKKGREAVPIITIHLSSENQELRMEAVTALAKMRDAAADAVPALEALINIQDDNEQCLVIAALEKITGDETYRSRQRDELGSTYWGLVPYDDPVYGEGYTITFGST